MKGKNLKTEKMDLIKNLALFILLAITIGFILSYSLQEKPDKKENYETTEAKEIKEKEAITRFYEITKENFVQIDENDYQK